MYPSIDNVRGIAVVTSFLNMRQTKLPSAECIIEWLKICLYHSNSTFAGASFLQINGTATRANNSCSYADIAVASIDSAVLDQKATCFNELAYFGRYRGGSFSLWKIPMEKLELLYNFLNRLSSELKFTTEVGS